MDKSYRGIIEGQKKSFDPEMLKQYPKNLGYIIIGYFIGHPEFHHEVGHTSLVVKKGRWKNGECQVETLNSRYTWRKPSVPAEW